MQLWEKQQVNSIWEAIQKKNPKQSKDAQRQEGRKLWYKFSDKLVHKLTQGIMSTDNTNKSQAAYEAWSALRIMWSISNFTLSWTTDYTEY